MGGFFCECGVKSVIKVEEDEEKKGLLFVEVMD